MGLGSGLHWIGVFLLFCSSILLLITTISAPVINGISLLRVNLGGGEFGAAGSNPSINFGTFGYCVQNVAGGFFDGGRCTGSHIGYDPAQVVAQLDNTSFESFSSGTASALTRVMVLHPIACGVAFLAFILACGKGIFGSFAGAMLAAVAWVITLISMAVDFSLFGIIKHHVDDDVAGSNANFGTGIWCLTAAFVTLFFGMFIVFFTCCANRREKRRGAPVDKEYQAPPPRRRKRFGIF